MTDADLIYSALLRAERKFEQQAKNDPTFTGAYARLSEIIVMTIRKEIGNGLADRPSNTSTEGQL